MKNIHNIHTKQKGFTLLFAVLLSTLVVSIGASIISIALRQTILSGTSRESQYAFYAANTVLECAFYWDITKSNVFPLDHTDQIDVSDTDASEVTCAGINIISGANGTKGFAQGWDTSDSDRTTFYLEIKDNGSISPLSSPNTVRCAQATVIKTEDSATGVITTRIEAKGYNSCDLSHPRTVERGLVQEYTS